MYNPNPAKTDDIVLPSDIIQLAEKLAENVHDIWALGRVNEGWIYGSVRDDVTKTHPCLVPYSELPESEKDYDRGSALETLKLILKLGYRIVKD